MSDVSTTIDFLGQVDVTKLNLISHSGKTISIIGLMKEISLYEDLFSNTLSGYIMIEDSLDLINNIPLIGQELLEIEFKTPTLTSKISKTFYVYKLQHRTAKRRLQTYMLNFCSQELIFSENSKVSAAFSGNITDTVTSIFRDPKYLASSSLLYTEKTSNQYSFIAPYWTPFATINWLTGKSLNSKGVPNYLFYETNQSFEYVSVDKLISAAPEREYIFSDVDSNTAVGHDGVMDEKYKYVQSMDTAVTFDYLRNLNAGMYSSKLYTMDMTTKNINVSTFDYVDDFSKSNHLEKFPLRGPDLLRKKIASLYFIHKNNYQNDAFRQQGYSKFFLQRNSLLEQLSAFKISIRVHGRTDIKAGSIITFTIPEMREILGSDIDTYAKSDYFSGRYLVTAIRHQIISGVHSMTMEIVSDSFVKQFITK
jgi:hypothetical protein